MTAEQRTAAARAAAKARWARHRAAAQDNAAAERSAPTPERGPDLRAAARSVDEPDLRKPYWVRLLDAEGRVVRAWQTRFTPEEEDADLECRIEPI